ncbi:MAG: hypothetical protein FH751_16635 [Firmicutes bacterium]|nr:hypothetical protein [Bacillota bacterium]
MDAPYCEEVILKAENNVLVISFIEKFTDDYSSNINNRLVYKINKHKKFECIKIFKNSKEISISSIWG